MRVATWNVNSIRSRTKRLVGWVERNSPDVLLLQETKTADDTLVIEPLADLGFQVAHHGVDHWNGVAIASRVGLDHVQRGFPGLNRAPFDEARVISATCAGIRFHSVYAPNGRTLDDPHYLFKLVWLERLRSVVNPGVATFLAGDLNVAPSDADIYDPKRWRNKTHASPPERLAIGALIDLGLHDVTIDWLGNHDVFTWWSYRPGQFEQNRGLRIDLALLDSSLAERVRRVEVDTQERGTLELFGEKPSDHSPLIVDLF